MNKNKFLYVAALFGMMVLVCSRTAGIWKTIFCSTKTCLKIREVKEKKQFMSLLLLADEQESMVDRYLEKGIIFSYNHPF